MSELEELRQKNQERIQQRIANGDFFNPIALIGLKVDLLKSEHWQYECETEEEFDLLYEKKVAEALDASEAQQEPTPDVAAGTQLLLPV